MLKNMKTIYVIGFGVMTIFGAFYYQDILLNPPKKETTPQPVTTKEKKTHSTAERIDRKFNVQGMYCESCKEKIETSVSKIMGVIDVSVDQSTNEMIVTYSKNNENIQQTLSTIKELGYTAGLKSKSGKLQVLDFNVTFQ